MEEIKRLMAVEEEHQNQYYRTKQRVKRDMDSEFHKRQELIKAKQEYKKQLEREIESLLLDKKQRVRLPAG